MGSKNPPEHSETEESSNLHITVVPISSISTIVTSFPDQDPVENERRSIRNMDTFARRTFMADRIKRRKDSGVTRIERGSQDTLDFTIHFSFLPGDRDTLQHMVMDRAEIGTTRRAGMRNVS